MSGEVMTLSEARVVLGVTKCRAWQMLKEGKLRGVKRANVWFIDPSTVRAAAATLEAKAARRAARRTA